MSMIQIFTPIILTSIIKYLYQIFIDYILLPMPETIENKFFSLFNMALVKEIFQSNPENIDLNMKKIGKEIGYRISEHFYSENLIIQKIHGHEREDLIRLFFTNYFDGKILIKNKIIDVSDIFPDIVDLKFFIIILNEVFKLLNDDVCFGLNENGNICF